MSSFIIFGAGRQGLALAYFLARYSRAQRLTLVDSRPDASPKAVQRLNRLLEKTAPENNTYTIAVTLDAADHQRVCEEISGHDVCVSALPHEFNLAVTEAALNAGVSYCDFGFSTEIIKKQLEFEEEAKKKGAAIILNCGVEPGLTNIVAVGGAKEFNCDTIIIYIGGNPVKPKNALRYEKLFTGLIHEYTGQEIVLENGELKTKDVPGELRLLYVPELKEHFEGVLAQLAFGPAAETLQKMGVKNAAAFTLRWPGHWNIIKALAELGFFDKKPVRFYHRGLLQNVDIPPLELTALLFDQNLPDCKEDFLILLIRFKKEGRVTAEVKMIDYHDPQTGFSAMQRTTSAPVAIIAKMLAAKKIPSGVHLPEEVVDWREMISELQKMGFGINVFEETTVGRRK